MKEKDKKEKKLPIKKRLIDTAKKTGIGTLGVVGGTGVAAGFGKWSPFLGFVMMGAGYFLGGKWNILTIAGAATIGYGVAKSEENRYSAGVGERFTGLKDDWLDSFNFKKLMNKSEIDTDEIISGIGAIDISQLDDIEEKVKESAIKHQIREMDKMPDQIEMMDEEDTEEVDFSIIQGEEEIDFNTF